MSGNKICLIIPSLKVGGMERVMSELANYLAGQNTEVWLVLMFRDEIFYTLDPRIQLVRPSIKKRFNATYAFYLFPFLRRRIKAIDADAVLSFGERYNSYVLIATLGLKTPVYISDRSSPHKRLSKFNLKLSKLLYRRAAGIIAQTSKAAELLSARLDGAQSNIRVIHNPLRKIELAPYQKKNQIIALGRLVREKRYDRLLKIMALLQNKSWKLVIVGEGRFRELIEKQIEEYGLQDRVVLAGQQRDVDSFLGESRIYVLTSDIEGFPNALCEAMAHGLACIAYDCVAGPSDIIRDGENGILVEEGDAQRYARELDLLIEDADKREHLGSEAVKIRDSLHVDTIFEEYRQFIFSTSKKVLR